MDDVLLPYERKTQEAVAPTQEKGEGNSQADGKGKAPDDSCAELSPDVHRTEEGSRIEVSWKIGNSHTVDPMQPAQLA